MLPKGRKNFLTVYPNIQLSVKDTEDPETHAPIVATAEMLNMEVSAPSAQVVDAYSALTEQGEISMTIVSFRWPNSETEMMNLRNDYTGNYAPDGDAYSFTSSRADFS